MLHCPEPRWEHSLCGAGLEDHVETTVRAPLSGPTLNMSLVVADFFCGACTPARPSIPSGPAECYVRHLVGDVRHILMWTNHRLVISGTRSAPGMNIACSSTIGTFEEGTRCRREDLPQGPGKKAETRIGDAGPEAR